jgi:hypothetical protein
VIEERVGNNDLRYSDNPHGGFRHVVLRDADDGDVIVVNEDDLVALRDRLTRTINQLENSIAPDDQQTVTAADYDPDQDR